jgi:beta-barrel assembly-enhancing protease
MRIGIGIGIVFLFAISLVSVDQEIEIGKQANAQIRKQVPELRDSETVDYLRGIGRTLVTHAGGPKYPYSFSVADYREINAFALPGGPVWIHRGILHAATNESQLAGVVAHEIAHISQRHAADQLTKATVASWGIGVMGALLGNDGGATTAKLAAGFLANGLFLKFSRDDEREADRVGLQLMTRAGWDARGMVELFEILRHEQKRDPGRVEMFFSTHPSPQDRISRLEMDVAKRRSPSTALAAGRRDSPRFQSVKARLLRMAPPKAMKTG